MIHKLLKYLVAAAGSFAIMSVVSVIDHWEYMKDYFSGSAQAFGVVIAYALLICACLYYIIRPE